MVIMDYYFKVMEKNLEIVRGITDELRTAPSPLLIRLKRIAEDPEALQEPCSVINEEINRIGKLITRIKPEEELNKIEKLDFINRKTKEAFQTYLSAWQHLAMSFEVKDEHITSYSIKEDIIEMLKGFDIIEINDKLIDIMEQKLPDDKLEIIKLLKDNSYSETDLVQNLTVLDFTEEEIDLILNYIKEKAINKITDSKKIEILQLLKNKNFSRKDLLDKLKKLKFTENEIELILKYSREDNIEDKINREKAVYLAEEAEKLLRKVQKLQNELRKEHFGV
jgi:SOS response regulatory protein OraA/RecX